MEQQARGNTIVRVTQTIVGALLLFALFFLFRGPIERAIDRVASLRARGVDVSFSRGDLTTANLPKTLGAPDNSAAPAIHAVDLVPFPFVKGQAVTGMAIFRNTSQQRIPVAIFHYVRIVDAPSDDRQTLLEDDYFSTFTGQITNDASALAMAPNSLALSWNFGPILSQGVLDAFNVGAKAFYFMGVMRYDVGQERLQAEYCRYTNSRGTFACKHHNGVTVIR